MTALLDLHQLGVEVGMALRATPREATSVVPSNTCYSDEMLRSSLRRISMTVGISLSAIVALS
jgi:hypothetical protein